MRLSPPATRAIAALGFLALGACAESPLTQPASLSVADLGPMSVGSPGDPGEGVLVCKVVAPVSGVYNFTVTAVDNGFGTVPAGGAFTLEYFAANPFPPSCAYAWRSVVRADGQEGGGTVTVTELPPVDQQVDSIVILGATGQRLDVVTGTNEVTVTADFHAGKTLKVYNGIKRTPPPPPTGIAGCTPGYWKQKHHFDSWVGYGQSDNFNAVFGRNFFSGGRTLLKALSTGGGGKDRFGRHATAALLSTANGGVQYGMTTAQVISAVQAAIDNGTYDKLSDVFEKMNERGCPLN
jgi:hypothetical protein